ncbi:MAG: hypothetical protein V1776_01730 [Candidatus Diapherotrites archaeon]
MKTEKWYYVIALVVGVIVLALLLQGRGASDVISMPPSGSGSSYTCQRIADFSLSNEFIYNDKTGESCTFEQRSVDVSSFFGLFSDNGENFRYIDPGYLAVNISNECNELKGNYHVVLVDSEANLYGCFILTEV